MALMIATGSLGEGGAARAWRDAAPAVRPTAPIRMRFLRLVIVRSLIARSFHVCPHQKSRDDFIQARLVAGAVPLSLLQPARQPARRVGKPFGIDALGY